MGIVKRDSIAITVLSYVGAAVGYVNKILLFPNFLSEEQVGLTSIIVTLAIMYAQFAALGVNSSVLKFFPIFKTPDKRHNGLFFWSFLTLSIGFIIFTTLFILFKEPVMKYFATNSPLLSEYYLWIIPLALVTLIYNFFNVWLQSFSKTVVSSFVYEVVLRLLITLEITIYALGGISFEQFMVWYIIIYSVPAVILLIYTWAIGEINVNITISLRVKKLIAIAGIYGIWQFMGGASIYILPIIDQTMLAGMQGLAQTGIYAIMTYMVGAMLIPYRSMIKVAVPFVTNYWKDRDMESMKKLYRKVSAMNLVIGCFFFLVIWVNLNNIFSLMPESYSAGRYVFLFLGLSRVFDMYAGLNGTILSTSKKYRYDFMFSILLIIMTIGTNILLIPRLGMTGAAIATALTLITYNIIRIGFVKKFFKMQPFASIDIAVMGITLAAIIISELMPYFGNFFLDVSIRTLIVSMIFGISVYYIKVSPDFNQIIDNFFRKLGLKTK